MINIEGAGSLANGVINSICTMTDVSDRNGRGLLFNHNRFNRYFFSQLLSGKQSRYKIETRNQPWDKDRNYSVAFGASAAQPSYTATLVTTKIENTKQPDAQPDDRTFLKKQPNPSDPWWADIQLSGYTIPIVVCYTLMCVILDKLIYNLPDVRSQ